MSGTIRSRGWTWRRISREAIRRQPWCSERGSREDLTADHAIPVSAGGLDTLGNARTLCRSCNAKRGSRPLIHVQTTLDAALRWGASKSDALAGSDTRPSGRFTYKPEDLR